MNSDLKSVSILKKIIMTARNQLLAISDELITDKICLIRGKSVMLDRDLAKLYDIETKVLKQTVRRNIDRFSADFMFELTNEEHSNLRSQSVTSSWGGVQP